METIKAANKVIVDGIKLLSDDAKDDFKAQAGDIFINEAIHNAMMALNGNEEKIAMLRAYAVQEANRVASTVWRLGPIPESFEKEYRALPSMKEMADEYNKFLLSRKERMDKIMEEHRVISEEEKDLDIFKGIVNGVSAEEAERKYNEFKNAQQRAMAGEK